MNVAIVDVGSNNIKLEIFEVNNEGLSHLVFSEKFQARLGADVFLTRKLRPENADIAVEALKQIRRITQEFKCKQTIAIATAALREFSNYYQPYIEATHEAQPAALRRVLAVMAPAGVRRVDFIGGKPEAGKLVLRTDLLDVFFDPISTQITIKHDWGVKPVLKIGKVTFERRPGDAQFFLEFLARNESSPGEYLINLVEAFKGTHRYLGKIGLKL